MDNQEEPKRPRRIRYKGTHPKSFGEKYKELQPEHYTEDIAKVIQQGRTPAGMHRSICVKRNNGISENSSRTNWAGCHIRLRRA